MKQRLYLRLAWQGISKNRRLYLPYLFTCAGMVMMTYILLSLASSPALKTFPGGDVMPSILGMGSFVMAAFAVLFLFYTNSFLIRRRNLEFGLYNILGMGKGNLARVMFCEALIIGVISIAGGEALGMLLGKLFELLLINIVGGKVSTDFSVSVPAACMTAILYVGIFLLIFLHALVKVCTTNAAALLKSEAYGEKPPRANWLFGLAGFAILGAAYYIAVSIQQPMTALVVFFIAVLMVIAATYLIFISGSVLLCRVLQKSKRYYYQKSHFISVSSMAYRMKRNGAGLASVCILATMVLVMLSSTTCLYFGAENALRTRYPQDISVEVRLQKQGDGFSDENIGKLQALMDEQLEKTGCKQESGFAVREIWTSGILQGDRLAWPDAATLLDYEASVYLTILPLEDYNAMSGSAQTLAPGQALICTPRFSYDAPTITIGNTLTYTIRGVLPTLPFFGRDSAYISSTIYLIVPDFADLAADSDWGVRMWNCSFDTSADDETQIVLASNLRQALGKNESGFTYESYSVESRAANRGDFYGTYGSLFFLGILLSIVFLAAAVLILYYKQVSEGYEDQARFAIMQRVGMTKAQIRSSINAQLLLIFFLPLLLAGVHLGFAFPFIHKMLILFNLNDLPLLIGTTVLTYAIYACFYAVVYRVTSNAYYAIVAGVKEVRR